MTTPLTLEHILQQPYDALENTLSQHVQSVATLEILDELRLHYVGKKGILSTALKSLGGMTPEERQIHGPKFNQLRDRVTQLLAQHKDTLEQKALDAKLKEQTLDVTCPVYPSARGAHHVLTQTLCDIKAYFRTLGFDIQSGPDIDTDYYNFDALNIPAHHPARQNHDTFYTTSMTPEGEGMLLRTHTSTIQIRTLEHQKPPLRILAPGRVYRADLDATHLPMFHQVEGLVIEPGIHVGHLKGILVDFCRHFFEKDDLKIRLRPSFFPFTEPSFEVDMWWGDRWLEVLGCGMIHPNVLKNVGLDPHEHQGFAFGLGVDRFAMLKYNVKDIRHFVSNHVRWLSRFA